MPTLKLYKPQLWGKLKQHTAHQDVDRSVPASPSATGCWLPTAAVDGSCKPGRPEELFFAPNNPPPALPLVVAGKAESAPLFAAEKTNDGGLLAVVDAGKTSDGFLLSEGSVFCESAAEKAKVARGWLGAVDFPRLTGEANCNCGAAMAVVGWEDVTPNFSPARGFGATVDWLRAGKAAAVFCDVAGSLREKCELWVMAAAEPPNANPAELVPSWEVLSLALGFGSCVPPPPGAVLSTPVTSPPDNFVLSAFLSANANLIPPPSETPPLPHPQMTFPLADHPV